MKTEDAQKIAGTALDRLAAALEAGQSEGLRAYLKVMSAFRAYSWRNTLLIASQRPEATHVAGYGAWKQMNRFVKRGEHGILIVAPMAYRVPERAAARQENPDDQDKKNTPGAERATGFRAVRVFDISQTDGEPLPELERVDGDPRDYLARLKTLVAGRGITLAYSEQLGGAYGMSAGGGIVVRSGLAPAEELAVLAHEVGHELMHHEKDARPASKKVRETEAEAVAFVVCHAIGLQVGSASADYIQLYDGNKDTLAASLERIQRTAAIIIEGIQVTEPLPQRAAA